MELSDNQYIVGIVKNNQKVLRQLYSEYLPSVSQFVQKNGGTTTDARAIFKEAILYIYHIAIQKNFQLTGSFQHLLEETCQDIWNYKKNTKTNATPSPTKATGEHNSDNFQTIINQQSEEQFFWSHFWKLSPKRQKTLQYFYEGKSLGEIRRLMDFSSMKITETYLKNSQEKLAKMIRSDIRYRRMISDQ